MNFWKTITIISIALSLSCVSYRFRYLGEDEKEIKKEKTSIKKDKITKTKQRELKPVFSNNDMSIEAYPLYIKHEVNGSYILAVKISVDNFSKKDLIFPEENISLYKSSDRKKWQLIKRFSRSSYIKSQNDSKNAEMTANCLFSVIAVAGNTVDRTKRHQSSHRINRSNDRITRDFQDNNDSISDKWWSWINYLNSSLFISTTIKGGEGVSGLVFFESEDDTYYQIRITGKDMPSVSLTFIRETID